MKNKQLKRSNDRILAGVAGGLAEHFNIDPTLVRIVFILLVALGGHGMIIYAILWFIMPKPDNVVADEYYNAEDIKVQDA
ncbi:MAG TPA: PspC domain-containing protein [Anaerolineae bacterium]|nr:PspC domain-containing protein [Anaerolineae bacterium]